VNRSLLKTFLSLSLAACPAFLIGLAPATSEAAPADAPASSTAGSGGVITGVVKNSKSKESIENAVVVLQCSCLSQQRETYTNARGVYRFTNLPQGQYIVQVLAGKASISKSTTLPRNAKFRANFTIDPQSKIERVLVVAAPIPENAGHSLTVSMDEATNLPVGADTSRDFTAVVDLAPTASRDAAGISLAGTTGAETKYTVEGADVTSPASGTVGATMIQEFVESVEIKESGYDAEFGGASGGQVSARRVSGSNTFRGNAGVRFAPRLKAARLIQGTDEALRVTQNADWQAQAYAIVSGPIKQDKLFFTFGVAPQATRYTLVQNFYHRVDKDKSGGYEDCPYENGTFDCVDGGNYIDTAKFSDQSFGTGALSFGYIAGLDWAITPNHRLRLTGQGGPGFVRTTYRMPFSADPNSFGTNPGADPLGGGSRIASGIVNEHFGWNMAQTTLVALGYEGRVNDGNTEIDANLSYFEAASEDAWRLDDPNHKNVTATQEQESTGANLIDFLQRDNAVNLVPGVEDACNDPKLPPGVPCPIRRWLSGGLGEYDKDSQRRVAGSVALTHFFNAAGSHQLKYGGQVEWEQRHSIFQYSGTNAPDFYEGCGSAKGGGEYCYDDGKYTLNNSVRVNNHRFVVVNTDTPDRHFTRGFGGVRKEENSLRAIADSLGRGARMDRYDESLSTMNYGVFLQDKWAILSNLYINAGVRWELQDMRDIYGDNAILIWDNVAPRAGIVYDWTDEGKSRLYASYGWFYQPMPLALNSRVFGGLVNVRRQYKQSDCFGGTTNILGADGVATTNSRTDDAGQPTEYCVDTASSTSGLSPGMVVPHLKGNYNQQFQVGYEQEVVEDLVIGFRWLHTDLGRAVEDVSTNGGFNFIIANPGEKVSQNSIDGKRAECDAFASEYERLEGIDPDENSNNAVARDLQQCLFLVDAYEKINTIFDKPTRNYDAWTLEIKKRFAKNWLMLASYTYSRLVGNYDGFVDPTSGSINIGASTQYDIPELVRNSYGPLSSDQPHRAKFDAYYTFDMKAAGRLTLGTSVRFASGYPISVRADNNVYPGQNLIYVLPRGKGGRIDPNYNWNLSASYAYPLPNDLEIEVSGRLMNITNAKAVYRIDDVYSFQFAKAIPGGDLSDLKHAKAQRVGQPQANFGRAILDPQGNFGVETMFQQPMSAQFELKLRF